MKTKFLLPVIAALALTPGCASFHASNSNAPLPLKVVGNKILNSKGEPMLLRGVNAASLEWTSDGQGHILKTVNAAIHRSEEHTSELQSLRHLVCRLLLE